MPEKVLKKLNTYILPQWKVCFFAAMTVGLFAHLYKIVNWLPNWDSLVFRYDPQNMLAMGRWFLPVVCSFSSFYDLPFLNGLIAIVLHGLGAVCICRMLDVQKKITAALIGGVIVSFPAVTSVMMYNYVADGYAFAFLLSVLAAFYMTKEKPAYIVSAVLIALAAGIYQAYITVTITLVLFHLLDKMIFKDAAFKDILKKTVLMTLSGIIGVVIYGVILKVILGIASVELLEYQGVNTVASLSDFDFAASLYVIKETFINSFFDMSQGINIYVALNITVMVLTLAYYIRCIVVNRVYKKPAIITMIIASGIMLIFGASALAIVNPRVDYHNLMLMGHSVFYLFFVIAYERGTEKTEKNKAAKCWVVLLISALLVFNQIVISNVSYHKAQMAYEKSYGTLIRIADRIEQTPGSEYCDKILVIGELDDSEAYSVNLTPDITGITDGYIIRADDEIVGQSVLTSSLNDYCGKNYKFISGDEKKSFMNREDVKAVNKWPAKDCVAVIDDTIVIKLGIEGED